jgi:hypothetical protein
MVEGTVSKKAQAKEPRWSKKVVRWLVIGEETLVGVHREG